MWYGIAAMIFRHSTKTEYREYPPVYHVTAT